MSWSSRASSSSNRGTHSPPGSGQQQHQAAIVLRTRFTFSTPHESERRSSLLFPIFLSEVLQPQPELRHVSFDIGVSCTRRGDVAVAARCVALQERARPLENSE